MTVKIAKANILPTHSLQSHADRTSAAGISSDVMSQ